MEVADITRPNVDSHVAIAIVPLIMLVAAIVAIVVALFALVAWIWQQYQTHRERAEWETFKDRVIQDKNDCATQGGTYKSDFPPQWTCENSNGHVITSGDYSSIFTTTPWDGDPRNYELQLAGTTL